MQSTRRSTPNACCARTSEKHERLELVDLSGQRGVPGVVRQFQAYVDASDPCACRVIVASRGLEVYVTLSPRIFRNRSNDAPRFVHRSAYRWRAARSNRAVQSSSWQQRRETSRFLYGADRVHYGYSSRGATTCQHQNRCGGGKHPKTKC